MKLRISLLAIALVTMSLSAFGGGDNDAPYNMPQIQTVEVGELGVLLTADPGTVTLTSATALVSLSETGSDQRPGTDEAGSGGNTIVTDNGTPGGTLVQEWEEQDGTKVTVTTKKGAGEKPKDFVKRHKDTVKLMKEAFPPV